MFKHKALEQNKECQRKEQEFTVGKENWLVYQKKKNSTIKMGNQQLNKMGMGKAATQKESA